MNKKSVFVAMKDVACMLLIFSIICAMTLMPAILQVHGSDPTVSFPSNYIFGLNNATIGTRFNVTLKVNDVSDLAAYQWAIEYNDTLVNVTRWYEPSWDPTYVFYGRTTLPAPYPDPGYVHTDPDLGVANAGGGLIPPPPVQNSFSGSGTLCIVEFEIKAVPSEGETLNCTLVIDSDDFFLLNSPGDEIPSLTKENGYYEIIPEFSPLLMALMCMGMTVMAIAFAKKIQKSNVHACK